MQCSGDINCDFGWIKTLTTRSIGPIKPWILSPSGIKGRQIDAEYCTCWLIWCYDLGMKVPCLSTYAAHILQLEQWLRISDVYLRRCGQVLRNHTGCAVHSNIPVLPRRGEGGWVLRHRTPKITRPSVAPHLNFLAGVSSRDLCFEYGSDLKSLHGGWGETLNPEIQDCIEEVANSDNAWVWLICILFFEFRIKMRA